MPEDEELRSWSDLPLEERKAIRKAAQSQIWWGQLGQRIRGMGPLVTAILACIALWQILGESLKEWLAR